MPFDQAFALSSVLLATTAFSGLVLAQSVPLWLALPTAIILIISLLHAGGVLFVRRAMAQVTVSPTLWNVLLIGAFVILLIDLTVVSRDLLPAGIHFLVVLLGIKLLTLQQRRDYRHLYAISLMAILASAALTTDAWYVPIFLLYLLAAVWTLLLYHLTQETGETPAVVTPSSTAACHTTFPSRITHRFFWLTNGTAVLTVALTLAIFFLIPRIGAGVLQKTSGEALRTTGFSDRVDLGTIGSVKQDPQIVMRVELPDQPAVEKDRLYLRGLAYDQYNGRSWSHSGTRRRSLSLVADGTFLARPAGSRPPDSLSRTDPPRHPAGNARYRSPVCRPIRGTRERRVSHRTGRCHGRAPLAISSFFPHPILRHLSSSTARRRRTNRVDPGLPRLNPFPLSSGSRGITAGRRLGASRQPTGHDPLRANAGDPATSLGKLSLQP